MAGEGLTLVVATNTELAASTGGDSSSFTSVGVEASVIVSLLCVEFDESPPFKASGETAGDSALCVGSSGADLVLIT